MKIFKGQPQAPPLRPARRACPLFILRWTPRAEPAGVKVTVLLAALPPKRMLALGSKVVFEDDPERMRPANEVSTSDTVKAKAEVGVPAVVV